jgi:serine/threonine protein kinase
LQHCYAERKTCDDTYKVFSVLLNLLKFMRIDTILRNRYKIVRLVGSGGFGDTYLAQDMDLPGNPPCVVKQLKPKSENPSVLQAARVLFDREAEILDKLGRKHDQIPRLFAHFEENGQFYLVQEFINGHDLSHELIPGKCWSKEHVERLLKEILEILAFVHSQGVIHRDIKPPNLMRRSQDGKIVLIDFGAVKEISTLAANTQGQSVSTVSIGSAGYTPAEQAIGHPQLASDIYSVGVLGIQALMGKIPERDSKTCELIWKDQVSVGYQFEHVLDKMVRHIAGERYPSAAEALKAIEPTVVTPIPPPPPNPNPSSFESPWYSLTTLENFLKLPRRKTWIGAGIVAITAGIALSFVNSKSLKCQMDFGTFAIPSTSDTNVYHFLDNGLAKIKVDNKWSFINTCGNLISKPIFKEVSNSKKGLLRVQDSNNKYGFIDKDGNYVIQPKFNWVSIFSEGLAIAQDSSSKYGFIDKDGNYVIQPKFNWVSTFSEGFAVAQENDEKYGYIDSLGNYSIKPQYYNAHDFSDGIAFVEDSKDSWSYINKNGIKLIVPNDVREMDDFKEGVARVKNDTNKWGYLNTGGVYEIKPKFDYAYNFSEETALVMDDRNKYGFIGKSGNYIISPRFNNASDFQEGFAVAKDNNNMWGYIDKTGNYVIQPKFEDAWSFQGGLALVKEGSTGKWGYIDKTGSYVIRPRFDKAAVE